MKQEDRANFDLRAASNGVRQESEMIAFFRELDAVLKLCREPRRTQQRPDRNRNPDRNRYEGRAGPARRRTTRRSRVGTPQPVPTGPVPKRSVPTRLRRVAHSNGRAIRLGIRTAVNAGRRRRATRRSRVGTPRRRAVSARHGWRGSIPCARIRTRHAHPPRNEGKVCSGAVRRWG